MLTDENQNTSSLAEYAEHTEKGGISVSDGL
jgi:hypothetical protein